MSPCGLWLPIQAYQTGGCRQSRRDGVRGCFRVVTIFPYLGENFEQRAAPRANLDGSKKGNARHIRNNPAISGGYIVENIKSGFYKLEGSANDSRVETSIAEGLNA